MRLLVVKLADLLLYESKSEHAETLTVYYDKKLSKLRNLNHTIWARSPKHFDKEILDAHFAKLSIDELMSLPLLTEFISLLETNLSDSTVKMDFKMEDFMPAFVFVRVAKVLEQAESDELLRHVSKMVKDLLNCIWFLTKIVEKKERADSSEKFELLLLIRKLLGACLALVQKATQLSYQLVQSGSWQQIISLVSLSQLRKLIPNEVTNIRNVLQFILIQIILQLATMR